MRGIKLLLCGLTFFAYSAISDDSLLINEAINIVSLSAEPSFLELQDMSDIKKNVSYKLQNVLSMPKEKADEVPVSRIFDTTWIQVNISGKSYITDQNARQWLGTDMSELFLFDEVAKRVVVGNDNRESLMDYTRLVSRFSDIIPVYPETRNGGESVVIYAFVDPSCPRCQEFHLTEMEKWRSYGVSWVYIPFLVDPDNKKTRNLAKGVFCADSATEVKDRVEQAYLLGAKKSQSLLSSWSKCGEEKEQLINSFLDSGVRHGLAGSPMFVTTAGEVYYGSPSLEIAIIKQLMEKFK
jgi:hypothetical protein